MGLEDRIEELEHEIEKNFPENLEKVEKLILDNYKDTIALTEVFIPEKAIPELRRMNFCNFPHGGGVYHSREEIDKKNKISKERWGFINELLEARYYKRIDKLWAETKERLEDMFGRKFADSEDLAIMFRIDRQKRNLKNLIKEMNVSRTRYEQLHEDNLKAEIWKNYHHIHTIEDTAENMIILAKDCLDPDDFRRPKEIFINDEKTGKQSLDVTHNIRSHTTSIFNEYDRHRHKEFIWEENLENMFDIIDKIRDGSISFIEALYFSYPEMVPIGAPEGYKQLSRYRFRLEIMEEVQELTDKIVAEKYARPDTDPEAKEFLSKAAEFLLERWKATAVDYDKLFYFHNINHRDKELLKFFYNMKTGGNSDKEIIEKGRIPELLRTLVKDNIISEEQIDPPLKERYLEPDEMPQNMDTSRIDKHKITEYISGLERVAEKPKILLESSPVKLITGKIGNALTLEDELSALGEVINSDHEENLEYEVLYKGKHTIFLRSRSYYPSGRREGGIIYRLTALPDDAFPDDGSIVTLLGQRFNVKKMKTDTRIDHDVHNMVSDTNHDAVPLKNYLGIIDMPLDEFVSKYFADFIFHVGVLSTENIGCDNLDRFQKINPEAAANIRIYLGFGGHSVFRTFEIDNKLGYTFEYRSDINSGDIIVAIRQITEYLRDSGIPFYEEANLDETGRNHVTFKKLEREFFNENIDNVVESLRGTNLITVISYLTEQKEYSIDDFGISREPCESCNQHYPIGMIYGEKEQYFEGMNCKDLHTLSIHPETYVNKYGDFRKICNLLEKVKGSNQVPVFIEKPEIIPEMISYSNIVNEYVKASSESMNDYMQYEGGIHIYYDLEEIDDNPELKKIYEHEQNLKNNEKKLFKMANERAERLQKMYEDLGGQNTTIRKRYHSPNQFWDMQVLLLEMYRIIAPKLLPSSKMQTENYVHPEFVMRVNT
ncbi:MAG: hypothetical protein ACLFPQ_03345 [Candidatus Woesearchaeota archaeon]